MSFRILVADESQPMRRLVCRFLEAVGIGRPIESGNASETLAQIKAEPFNVVIVDINMPSPGPSGVELISAIRAVQSEVRLVVMTTEADENFIHAAMEAGASEYLVKPFGVEARQRLLELCQQERPLTLPKMEWAKGP